MSSHSNVSKFEKEKQKFIQEKCLGILNDMLRDEDNKYCVDCDAKGPRWASWNLGIFLCIRCAGIHRNLGVHISRVKSVNLDSWTPEQVVTIQQMGNSRARALYEANMPDTLRRPQTDSSLESFIRAKYEQKRYIAKEWVAPPPVKVNWDSEIEEGMRKNKEGKKVANSSAEIGPIPTPVSKPPLTATKTAAKASAPAPIIDVGKVIANTVSTTNLNGHSTVTSSASEDLLGLMGDSTSFTPISNQDPTSMSTSVNTVDELGSLFLSPTSTGTTDLGKMSKESILSLYGSAPTTPSANPFIQGSCSAVNSPFNLNLPSTPLSGQTTGFPSAGYNLMNTNAQMSEHSMHQTNNSFPALNQMGVASGYGGQPQLNDLKQVQNQFSGLNFGLSKGTATQVGGINPGWPSAAQPAFKQMTPPQMTLGSPMFPPQPPKTDNLLGLGTSVNQLMQPSMSGGTNFWK